MPFLVKRKSPKRMFSNNHHYSPEAKRDILNDVVHFENFWMDIIQDVKSKIAPYLTKRAEEDIAANFDVMIHGRTIMICFQPLYELYLLDKNRGTDEQEDDLEILVYDLVQKWHQIGRKHGVNVIAYAHKSEFTKTRRQCYLFAPPTTTLMKIVIHLIQVIKRRNGL